MPSTVGHGDQYPVTNPGRVLGAVSNVLAYAIFGTLTGYLANLFLSPGPQEEATNAAAGPPPGDPTPVVDQRLARLAQAGELHQAGLLTVEEFETVKLEVLATWPQATGLEPRRWSRDGHWGSASAPRPREVGARIESKLRPLPRRSTIDGDATQPR